MPKFPVLSAKDILRVASKLGFVVVRQSGSHIILKHSNGKLLVIPNHSPLKTGTALCIVKQLGISREDFCKML